jgi:hypothetical protein
MKRFLIILTVIAAWAIPASTDAVNSLTPKEAAQGWKLLWDGKTLNGWKLVGGHGPGYLVQDARIVCPADGGGNLFTEKEYANFVFRFEFKLEEGSNNGIGIRAPYEGDAAYQGMEIQILDNDAPRYRKLRAAQYHGSIYDVIPAKTGFLKPTGQWNEEEITARGRRSVADQAVVIAGTFGKRPGPPAELTERQAEIWRARCMLGTR